MRAKLYDFPSVSLALHASDTDNNLPGSLAYGSGQPILLRFIYAR